jgi:nicotinate-nucleotide pyrophosphorylase (carboxylating)
MMNQQDSILTEKDLTEELVMRALDEDIRSGDVTTNAIVDESKHAQAVWTSKEEGIIAGLDVAQTVFRALDPNIEWKSFNNDGDEVNPGSELISIRGSCRAILTAERTALNFAQRMSGIATKTRKYVNALSGYETKILDTRKTVPGLRALDKYAVSSGGGTNHRMGLFDLVMIKDNHIVAAGGISQAVAKVRRKSTDLKIEVETTSLEQVEQALSAGVDIIMLDNMSPEQMKEAVLLIDKQAETEASGNITLENVKEVAETGVDYISVGALTHSVKAFDISQELKKIV